MTPRGAVISEFALSSDAEPFDITAHPDGSIWKTSREDSAIWRISPNGVGVQAFHLGEKSLPALIAVGPDGNIWFADMSGKLGRVTGYGFVSEFPVTAESR